MRKSSSNLSLASQSSAAPTVDVKVLKNSQKLTIPEDIQMLFSSSEIDDEELFHPGSVIDDSS